MATLGLAVLGLVGRTAMEVPSAPEGFGGVEAVGFALFRDAAVPFELIAVTLTVAALGVVGITRGKTAVEAAGEAKRPEAE